MERLELLIDNKLCRKKIVAAGEQFNGKKERSRRLNKTVNPNAADILSNISATISDATATSYLKNAGVVITTSIASEDRKTLRLPYLYRYNKIADDDIYKKFEQSPPHSWVGCSGKHF